MTCGFPVTPLPHSQAIMSDIPQSFIDSQETTVTFVADVLGYAGGLSTDSLSNLIGFFHLASPVGARVNLEVDASGGLTLRIEADGR